MDVSGHGGNVEGRLRSTQGNGDKMTGTTSHFFERTFEADLSDVNIHNNERSYQMADRLQAKAFTVGNDIYFGKDQYDDRSVEGRKLLAHELTHTLQQRQNNTNDVIQKKENRSLSTTEKKYLKYLTMKGLPLDKLDSDDMAVSILQKHMADTSIALSPKQKSLLVQEIQIGHYSKEEQKAVIKFLNSQSTKELGFIFAQTNPLTPADVPIRDHKGTTRGDLIKNMSTDKNKKAIKDLAEKHFPAKDAVCGPDVDVPFAKSIKSADKMFSKWNGKEKRDHCFALISYDATATNEIVGAVSWDIRQLYVKDWISEKYRQHGCATVAQSPSCGATVQIGKNCYYAGSPNYVIFGKMFSLCNKHFKNITHYKTHFSKKNMHKYVDAYKGPGLVSSASGNYKASKEWADAGFDGWSQSKNPKGDRNNCKTTCPKSRTADFTVVWGSLSKDTR